MVFMIYIILCLIGLIIIVLNLKTVFKKYKSGEVIPDLYFDDLDLSINGLLLFQAMYYVLLNIIWSILLILLTLRLVDCVFVSAVAMIIFLLYKPIFKKICKLLSYIKQF